MLDGEQDILDRLRSLQNANEKFCLVTIFKSIPLAFDAEFFEIDYSGIIFFRVHKYQLAAIVLIKKIFIYCEGLPEFVSAQVVRMDPVRLIVGLSGLCYAGNSMGKRTLVRVEPGSSIPVHLKLNKLRVMAELANLSVRGMSIYLESSVLSPGDEENEKFIGRFEIELDLPGEDLIPLRLKCAIRHVGKDALSGRYRVGLQLFPDLASEKIISDYITRRQASVLQDLKILYERSLAGGNS